MSPSWGSRRTGHPPEEVGSRTRSGLELFFFFLRESELGISVDRSPPPKRSGFGRVSHPVGTRPLFFCESEGAELGISEDSSPPEEVGFRTRSGLDSFFNDSGFTSVAENSIFVNNKNTRNRAPSHRSPTHRDEHRDELYSRSRSWIHVAHRLGYMPAEFQLESLSGK